MVVKFSQTMLKTFTRAVDNVISYIAKVINANYSSNMCCCMNNKQLIQLFTPNYSKVFTHFDAIGYDLKMTIPPKQRKHISQTSTSVFFKVFIVYMMSCICRGYYSTIR